MKEAPCLALFSITYHEERAVNCLKKDFFFIGGRELKAQGKLKI